MGVLRAEIRRLARKETKEAVRDLKRQVAAIRRRLAATKKRMSDVERTAQRAGSARAAAASRAESAESGGTQVRFSPRWVRVHRSKLGMSRRVYAKLVGVSPQTILLWESGKARPRRSALASWRALRGKGIRELKAAAGGEGRPRRGRKPGSGRKAGPGRKAGAGRKTKPVRPAGKRRAARGARGARKKGGTVARAARKKSPRVRARRSRAKKK